MFPCRWHYSRNAFNQPLADHRPAKLGYHNPQHGFMFPIPKFVKVVVQTARETLELLVSHVVSHTISWIGAGSCATKKINCELRQAWSVMESSNLQNPRRRELPRRDPIRYSWVRSDVPVSVVLIGSKWKPQLRGRYSDRRSPLGQHRLCDAKAWI